MEFDVDASNIKARKFIAHIMPSIIDQLGLTNSRRAVLVKVTKDIPDGLEGSALNIEVADCYLVLLRAPARYTMKSVVALATTLAHEMVHVRQLAKGMLRYANNDTKYWMGKRYTKKVAYLDQPWELDAMARQEIVVRRALAV